MDLHIFHTPRGDRSRGYPMKDKLNGWTGRLPCRFLEWTGWYNYNIAQRFLGHYRLYQLFKAGYARTHRNHHIAQAYIESYKTHWVKYFISRSASIIYSIGAWSAFHSMGKLARMNHRLVNEQAFILQEFLNGAHVDFEAALDKAVQQMESHALFNRHKERSVA